jgi:uncharacterized protein
MAVNTLDNNRIQIIDAIRGFALMGIVLVHMVEQFLAAAPTEAMRAGMVQGPMDQWVDMFLMLFVRGKFFAMFSFLFGLSFFIQMDRAAQRGVDYHGRFLWRVALLLVIGYLHSLFYRGDILTIYAVLAFVLVPFYRVSDRYLLIIAAILMLGAGRYLVFAVNGDATIFPYGAGQPDLPHNLAYYDALLAGSLMDVFSQNAVYGHLSKLEFQMNTSGRWYLTFAFFLLGLWAGRMRLFERLDELHAHFKKTLIVSACLTVLFVVTTTVLFGMANQGEGNQSVSWVLMFALSSLDLFNLALAIVLLCAFVLWFRHRNWGRALGILAPYGRMALTNYVFQTLVGTFLFYNYGLGLLGAVSNAEALGIGILVIAFQIWISALWLQYFRYGPLEWLWRSGTRLSWQSLVRQPA